MAANDTRQLDYTNFSSTSSSSVLSYEDVHPKITTIIAPFIFTLMTMTAIPHIASSDISVFSQQVTICQSYDIVEQLSKEEIIKQFVSKLVIESKDIDPEIAEIVNRNYRELLW